MKYGVKSKTTTSYLKEFDLYEDARVFVLKQQQIWKNATMQIYEIEGFQKDRLVEQFNPTKGTDYTKVRKNKNKLSDTKPITWEKVKQTCVVLISHEDKTYQVALNNEQMNAVIFILPQLFDDHVIKIVEEPLDITLKD